MTREKKLVDSLRKKTLTVSLAESMTGGLVSSLLTGVPGASKVFLLGAVVYTLKAKNKLLGLPLKNLKKCQGVSADTAVSLAREIKRCSGSDIGASIVGFAGPRAPQGKKGLVYMAVCRKGKPTVKEFKFQGSRKAIRDKAAAALLALIDEHLQS